MWDLRNNISRTKLTIFCLLLFQFRQMLVRVLAVDFFLSLIMDRLCLILFGEGKLRNPS